MKSNVVIFYLLTAFFLIMGCIYIGWTIAATGQLEWAGALTIVLSGALTGFVGFYFDRVNRAQGGIMPADRVDADIDDGDPEIGQFSPWSWWPMFMAACLGVVIVGACVGFWIAFFGLPLLLIAIVGWVYEYYRGNFAR
ncbi:hypothetical protein GCM10022198_08250 [Klugiella xanthotipulae]|uniref:Cytochrome c oxidase polypeptide 4 n=1 Tax=Klugiella xanthotipulae TaxID=244735 RepID=A0A543HSV2_9MICO|nr:cytochrome c oxidase subunit 4 [Klugiella xanthotipulae]TQM61415.1 cytochrome c oxidase subunit IV [Klugiella xanthotipulae]